MRSSASWCGGRGRSQSREGHGPSGWGRRDGPAGNRGRGPLGRWETARNRAARTRRWHRWEGPAPGPPGRQELERGLRGRSREDEGTLARRLASAGDEIARCAEYAYVLVNGDLDRTVESLEAILHAERLRIPEGGSRGGTRRATLH